MTSPTSSVIVPASGAVSALSLADSTTSTGYGAAGDTISYNYLVTNTGTTTLSGVSISDSLIPSGAISCPGGTLAPAASVTCTGTYQVTQADVDAGSVTDTATTRAANPAGDTEASTPSSVTRRGGLRDVRPHLGRQLAHHELRSGRRHHLVQTTW